MDYYSNNDSYFIMGFALGGSLLSFELDRTTFRERYAHMLASLRSQILSGELVPGDYIPPERVLIEQFQLSKPSVRKVLSTLVEEGLIHTVQGKGSIVNDFEDKCTVIQLFWFMPSYEFSVISEIVERFNKVNKQIKVEITQISRNAISTATEGLLLGKVRPDLIGLGNNYFLYMIDKGLDKFLRPIRHLLTEDLFENVTRSFTHGNQLYAAPITFSPVVLAYNKTLFHKKGLDLPNNSWTWNELLHASRELTEVVDDKIEQYGFGFTTGMNRWPLFVLQNGGTFLNPDNKPSLDDELTMEALQFTIDLMYKHKVSPIYSSGIAAVGEELFLRQKVGMMLTSYMFMEQFKDLDFEWDYVMFPGQAQNVSFGLTSGIGIGPSCTSIEAANKFIQYALSDTMQAFIKKNASSIPARQSIASSRSYQTKKELGQSYYLFEQLVPHMKTLGDLGLSYEEFARIEKELGLLWANVESVEAVAEYIREVNNSI
ncbi:MAG: transporter substrate-binding protein [Paenibacillus sp.]|jgi:multiple sugar transport system substrate-binding protein|nr:transporter substrate-binding protein [Paenibacillus sp.]